MDTDLGRVGVGICYDTALRFLPDALIAGDAHIAVMSCSVPTPHGTWHCGQEQVEAFLASFPHGARNYADAGVYRLYR